jgi:hypothetical protein
VQRALFDGDADRVALANPRGPAEAPDERGPLLPRELLHRAIVSDVLGQLTDLLGDRGARRDREVHQDLRAERFAQLGMTAQPRHAGLDLAADRRWLSTRVDGWRLSPDLCGRAPSPRDSSRL